VLNKVLEAKGRVRPSFSLYHVVKALIKIYEEGPIGRQLLSKTLGLGEASTRTLIRRLANEELVKVDPIGGCILTSKGLSIVKELLKRIHLGLRVEDLLVESLKLSEYAYATMVKGGCKILDRIKPYEVRDEIIKSGADAALIVCVINGKAVLPGGQKVVGEDEFPQLKMLRERLKASDNDLILIAYCKDPKTCEEAALIAALNMVQL